MFSFSKPLATVLAVTVLLGPVAQAGSEIIYFPKLGYPAGYPVLLPVTLPPNETLKQKLFSRTPKAEKDTAPSKKWFQREKADKNPSGNDSSDKVDAKKAKKESPLAAKKGQFGPFPEENKDYVVEQKWIAADQARIVKGKKMQEEDAERDRQKRLNGDFYLFSLKDEQLFIDEPGKVEPQLSSQADQALAFPKKPKTGLYDIVVRGSGHRSNQPLYVSSTVFYDALTPLLTDFYRFHCPQVQGAYSISQNCYRTMIEGSEPDPLYPDGVRPVLGGWYQPETAQIDGRVKETTVIADVTNFLISLYQSNPKAMKLINLAHQTTTESPMPDILDEANWGIQYLLSAQLPSGLYPAGILELPNQDKPRYQFAKISPNATAKAIVVLAKAVPSYRLEDMGLSVKMLRAAEKAYDALLPLSNQVDAKLMAQTAQAMAKIDGDPRYQEKAQTFLSALKNLTPAEKTLIETGLPYPETGSALTGAIAGTYADLLEMMQGISGRQNRVMAWVQDQYGYESVSFSRDPSLEVANSVLEETAIKTGDVASKVGRELYRNFAPSALKTIPSQRLQAIEERSQMMKRRLLSMTMALPLTLDQRGLLAYSLTILNSQYGKTEDEGKAQRRNLEGPRIMRGHWPNTF